MGLTFVHRSSSLWEKSGRRHGFDPSRGSERRAEEAKGSGGSTRSARVRGLSLQCGPGPGTEGQGQAAGAGASAGNGRSSRPSSSRKPSF